MRQSLSWSKHKKSQIYMYDIFVALILASVLFYISFSQFAISGLNTESQTLSQAYELIEFLSSTTVSELTSVDENINEALGLTLKEHIVKPDTSIAETMLVLYYVNDTRLDKFLETLDDFVYDDFGRFNYWISFSNSTDEFFYNHSNVEDLSSYLTSSEFTSSSVLVTYGNFTKIYGPAILTVTVWKD